MSQLISYIENYYERVKVDINNLMPHINKVVRVHGYRDPHLPATLYQFLNISADIDEHINKASKKVFVLFKNTNHNIDSKVQNEINQEIVHLRYENSKCGKVLDTINLLTDNFNLPDKACKTYSTVYERLNKFQDDIRTLLHVENNILFDKLTIK